MTKRLLFLLFAFIFGRLGAQMWAPPGATWIYRCINPGFTQENGYLEVKFTQTVVSNGKTCRVLDGHFYGTWNNPPAPVNNQNYVYCVTYESNGVVFIQTGPSRFDTIANYNALPGQGWYSFGWDTTCNQFGISRVKHVVYDTSHVTINGQYLKRLTMTPPSSSNPEYILEKIGPLQGFLYTYYTCYMDGWARYGNFSCYRDNNFSVYTVGNQADCNFTGLKEQALNALAPKLWPNPNNGNFYLSLAYPDAIEIYNSLGQNIYSRHFESPGTFLVNVEDLPAGVYFVKSSAENSYGRFVKE